MNLNKLTEEFYLRDDVVQIAKELLGKKLCTHINGQYTSGIITETEAYRAPEDPASHAFNHRKTKRTAPFFAKGGIAYVYLIYGIYKMFNVVTNVEDKPHAILIRSIEPVEGIEIMLQRRNLYKIKPKFTQGPGLVAMALGIELIHNYEPLNQDLIWIENAMQVNDNQIMASPRIGLGKNVFEPYFSMPWNFKLDKSFN